MCSCYDNDDGRPIREDPARRDSLNHPAVLLHNGRGVERSGKRGGARNASGDFAGRKHRVEMKWKTASWRCRWERAVRMNVCISVNRLIHCRPYGAKLLAPLTASLRAGLRGVVIIRRSENPSSLVDLETSAELLAGNNGEHWIIRYGLF